MSNSAREVVHERAQQVVAAAVQDGWVGHRRISEIVTPADRAACRKWGLMNLNIAILEYALDRRWLMERKHYWVPGPGAHQAQA